MTRASHQHIRAANPDRAIGHGSRRDYQPGGMDQRLELRDQDTVSGHAVDDPDHSVAGVLRNYGIDPINRQADDLGQYRHSHPRYSPVPHTGGSRYSLSHTVHNHILLRSAPYYYGRSSIPGKSGNDSTKTGTYLHAAVQMNKRSGRVA